MNLKAINQQTGFSLIEALIAALVVGIGLLGLARLQSSFFTGTGENRIQNAALHFAQRQVEDLRGFESKSLLNDLLATPVQGFCVPDHDNDPENDKDCHGTNADLTRDWTSKNCEPNTALPCKTIDLSVTWIDSAASNTPKKVQLIAYVASTEPVDAGVAIAQLTP